jgi:hypothetical protein
MRLDHLKGEGSRDTGIEGVAAFSVAIPTAVAIQCVE